MNDTPLRQLVSLAADEASGDFVCESAGLEVHVFLQAGRVAWASDSQHPRAFLGYLKERAQLDDDALEQVLSECRQSHAPLGETLLAWKMATPEQVRAALRHQIGMALATIEHRMSSAKAMFLSRPHYTRYNADFTFELRDLLASTRQDPVAGGSTVANGAGRENAARAAPPPPDVSPVAEPAAAAPTPVAAVAATAGAPAKPPPSGLARMLRSPHVLASLAGLVVACALVAAFALNRSPEQQAPGASASPSGAAASTGVAQAGPDEIVFGMAGPFSGAAKELGRGMRTGVETAFALANEGGGVNGRKLRLVARDDGYDPSRTLPVMQELVESWKVSGIVGNVGTSTAAVAVPYAVEKKVLFFGALSGGAPVRKNPPDRYIFNFRPGYAEETAAAVRYLVGVRQIPPSQIGVFYQDDEFGRSGLAGVREQMMKLRHAPEEIVSATYKRNSADVASAVALLRKERLRAVVMTATCQAALQLIQQLKDAGADLVFTNVSAVDADDLAEGLTGSGRGYTSDVVVTQIVPLPTARSTAALEYRAALAKHGKGEKPGFVSFEGFIVGKILAEGLRRAGKDPTTETLVAAMEDLRGLDIGVGGTIGFAPGDHQASHRVWGTMLQPDGSYSSIRLE